MNIGQVLEAHLGYSRWGWEINGNAVGNDPISNTAKKHDLELSQLNF